MNANTRTALIIGASRGLGLGLATQLVSRGWHVIATARQPGQSKGLQALFAAHSEQMELEAIDVDRTGDLDALAQRQGRRRLHLLFLNAGIMGPKEQSALKASREDIAQIMWTNAVAPIRIAERLLPQVVEGGTVAFMSSHLGSVAANTSGGHELYRMSKASLNTLVRGFAVTHAQRSGVTVLSLHPGWVRTDMGGPEAPLSVEDSTRGLADVLEKRHGRDHFYLDYKGQSIPW